MKIAKISLLLILIILTAHIALGMPNNLSLTVVPSEIQFQLIDPVGNRTGYDPITGIVTNIPNTLYILTSETPLTRPADKYHKGYTIESKSNSIFSQVMPGKYQLKLFGSNIQEQYSFDIHVFYYNDANDMTYFQNNKTLIYPNATWTYEFDVPAVPPANGQIILTKVSTSADLIKDITTAGQLGYIGNAKFVSELTKEINEIEVERTKVDPSHGSGDDGLTPTQKAKKEYTELLREITEKYNKPESDEFVKQEAYTVLKEDLEYIISHL